MFLYFVGLGLYTEGVAMMDDLPAYGERINELVDRASLRMEHFQETSTAPWFRGASRKACSRSSAASGAMAARRGRKNKKKQPDDAASADPGSARAAGADARCSITSTITCGPFTTCC